MARHPTLRSRLLTCLITLAVGQGWIVAPYADVARDHDPIRHAACPTSAHLEVPIDGHGVLGCILSVAATLVGPPSLPPVGPVLTAPPFDARDRVLSFHPIAADRGLLPPSRAPPTHG